jgi:hypothetical protein
MANSIEKIGLTIGPHNDSQGETEPNNLFIIIGREGAYAPDGELGDGCHVIILFVLITADAVCYSQIEDTRNGGCAR